MRRFFIVFMVSMVSMVSIESVYAQTSSSVLSSGKWVKIRVGKEGVYQLTTAKLSQMGFTDPAKVKLYGYGLEMLPEANIENLDDDLTEIPLWRGNDGKLLFYAHGTTQWSMKSGSSNPIQFTHRNNQYSLYNYYFLTEGDSPKAFPKEDAVSGGTEVTIFPEHALIEQDEFSFINAGCTFYESYDFATKNTKTYTLSLPGIADSKAWIDVAFAAAGSSASTLNVKVNGTQIGGSTSFRKLVDYEYGVEKTLSATCTNAEESSEVTLTHTRAAGVAGHLDYIRACYNRHLYISQGALLFRPSKGGVLTYKIDGANSNTHVWRVTTPATTGEIAGTLSDATYKTSAASENWQDEEYVAVNTDATFQEPEFVGKVENQNLHALKDIDLVIIVPANGLLTEAAQELANVHQEHDSMRCVVVRADQIYNEFSSGTPDATAYRRLMKMLYDRATTKADRPKNLCLFGDGVWDNRMVTTGTKGLSQDDYLLCRESVNSVSHTDSHVLEEYFTLLEDGMGEHPVKDRPNCGVGRIPVTTAAQAKAVVSKLSKYITNDYAGNWQNTICMMADDGNANIHMKDAEAIVSQTEKLYPNIHLQKIYLDAYTREQSATGNSYPGATQDIEKRMEDGALIMNYTGHGAAYCLSHEQILKTANFAEWASPRLPLWIHAACDVSPFDMNTTNIGETALLNAKGGAMGVLSTTRTVYSSQNRSINLLFMKYVLSTDENGRRLTIGEALQRAKDDIYVNSSRDSINKAHFVLLGDPAITLASPTPYNIYIDQFDGKDIASIDTISAGKVVTVKGYIGDANGKKMTNFSGLVSPTIFDSRETITCKNNAGEDITPYEFQSRTRTLYTGTDSVQNGEFTFTFRVPLENGYTYEPGLLSLYAINGDLSTSANGKFENFAVGGTDPSVGTDSIGPAIDITLQTYSCTTREGQTTFASSMLMPLSPEIEIHLEDSAGINITGTGIGHDITLTVDNDASQTYNLNSYFSYDNGSWTSGSITYTVPEMTEGKHIITLHAWNILGSPTTVNIQIQCVADYDYHIVYDIGGREMWNGTGDGYLYTLRKGIYIVKSVTGTKKIMIRQ